MAVLWLLCVMLTGGRVGQVNVNVCFGSLVMMRARICVLEEFMSNHNCGICRIRYAVEPASGACGACLWCDTIAHCVTAIQRTGTPSSPIWYGFVASFLGGRAHRALPGFWSSSFPLFRIAISITAIRMKSLFSRISR